jgi:hypothetical protein
MALINIPLFTGPSHSENYHQSLMRCKSLFIRIWESMGMGMCVSYREKQSERMDLTCRNCLLWGIPGSSRQRRHGRIFLSTIINRVEPEGLCRKQMTQEELDLPRVVKLKERKEPGVLIFMDRSTLIPILR